ncbi:MAG TPA: hypothetical protein VK922_14425 [Gemmatimonadaceae bacterium]|nr:hypothetical protein [Gemmatimonadaceae bacterium]
MEPPRDFCELLECFNANRVKALIVGAYALGFHGAPRMTGDLDLFLEPSAANAERVMAALEALGFGEVGLSAADFCRPDAVIQLGVTPVRVDLLTGISGVTWEEAWPGRVESEFGGVPAAFLGLAELRRNKRAAGRHRDLADLEALGGE